MSREPFSAEWAAALGAELEASAAYRVAARDWEGSLALERAAEDGTPAAGVLLDLAHGRCREARAAADADLDAADFRIRGADETWRRLLAGDVDPLLALMTGRLELIAGSLARLALFGDAARELVAAARRAGGDGAGGA